MLDHCLHHHLVGRADLEAVLFGQRTRWGAPRAQRALTDVVGRVDFLFEVWSDVVGDFGPTADRLRAAFAEGRRSA